MKRTSFVFAMLLSISAAGFAVANGAWLKKVPEADRARTNPYAGNPEAIAAGANLFQENCSRCHGDHAQGKGSRPSLVSERIHNATDGEIFWLVKNGEIYKGMPNWSGLPEQERWQIIAYIRSLNTEPAPAQPQEPGR